MENSKNKGDTLAPLGSLSFLVSLSPLGLLSAAYGYGSEIDPSGSETSLRPSRHVWPMTGTHFLDS